LIGLPETIAAGIGTLRPARLAVSQLSLDELARLYRL
jgi:hypothetical protein